MRRAIKVLVLTAVVGLASAPESARAEGYFNPWAGITFANEDAKKGLGSFGVAVGDTGSKTGIDVNFGYSPKFFGDDFDNSVIDLMGNLTFGPQVGRGSTSARPYGVAGVGLLRTSVAGESSNNFGFNVGAGVFAFFSTRLGMRAEVRYFRTLNGTDIGDFHFMRAQLGLVLR